MSPKIVTAASRMLALAKTRSMEPANRRHRPIESLKAGQSSSTTAIQNEEYEFAKHTQMSLKASEWRKWNREKDVNTAVSKGWIILDCFYVPFNFDFICSYNEISPLRVVLQRCSACNDDGDMVFCEEDGCKLAFCCDWMDGEGTVLGCLSLQEVKNLEMSREKFICPSCSTRKKIPFKVREVYLEHMGGSSSYTGLPH